MGSICSNKVYRVMLKLHCPYCNKISVFEDTGVGWKCPDCTGHVFTQYTDKDGDVHYYDDRERANQRMMEQTHFYDMDAMDTMVGVTEPGPMYNSTFGKIKKQEDVLVKLAKLANCLDKKGFIRESDIIDLFLQDNKNKKLDPKKLDPLTREIKDKTYIDLDFFPQDNVHSYSGEPMSNL